jgi:sec-independent protein translocase protein TatB
MFDFFSWSHILIMLVVALVVVGPKDLPRLMNMAGKWAGKARGMAAEFRRSFDEMARESELAELRKEIDDLKKNNPISDLANSMASVESEVTSSVEAVAPAVEAVEPRSGEFAVTDSAPHAAPAPHNAPVVETP